MNTRKCEHKLIQKTATTLINFLTSDDFCPFDWDINQTHLYGRKTTIGGGGGGVAVPGGGIVPYARGGVVARKFRIKRLKETILPTE